MWEDDSPENYTLKLNGQVVVTTYNSGPAGTWAKLGPFDVTLATAGTIQLAASNGTANFSGLELWRATSGPPTNQPPTANAGPDQTLTLPTSSTALAGSGTDADGTITGYAWTQVNGPNTAAFSTTTAAAPTVSGLVAGTYTFRLVITDNQAASSPSDDVAVQVNTTPTGPQVRSYTLINANTGQAVRDLVANDVLNLALLPSSSLNIRANTSPATVGSVVLVLSGTVARTQTETVAPYALFGDNGAGTYTSWTPPLGSYSLQATPYSGGGGTGTAGTPLTLAFSVTNQAAAGTAMAVTATGTRQSAELVKAYPNPSGNGRFTLELPALYQGEVTYTLFSSLGTLVASGQWPASPGTVFRELDVAQPMHATGLYYLHLSSAKAHTTLRLQRQ